MGEEHTYWSVWVRDRLALDRVAVGQVGVGQGDVGQSGCLQLETSVHTHSCCCCTATALLPYLTEGGKTAHHP